MEVPDTILDYVADRIADRLATRQPVQTDPLMTVSQAAVYLQCSKQKIRDLVKSGALKKCRGFTDTRLRRSTLDQYGKE